MASSFSNTVRCRNPGVIPSVFCPTQKYIPASAAEAEAIRRRSPRTGCPEELVTERKDLWSERS